MCDHNCLSTSNSPPIRKYRIWQPPSSQMSARMTLPRKCIQPLRGDPSLLSPTCSHRKAKCNLGMKRSLSTEEKEKGGQTASLNIEPSLCHQPVIKLDLNRNPGISDCNNNPQLSAATKAHELIPNLHPMPSRHPFKKCSILTDVLRCIGTAGIATPLAHISQLQDSGSIRPNP